MATVKVKFRASSVPMREGTLFSAFDDQRGDGARLGKDHTDLSRFIGYISRR